MQDRSWYKQLRYQPIETQEEQYNEKNMVLEQFGEWVRAWDMYEDIFPDMDMLMPIVIIDEEEQKHILKMTIDEATEMCQGRNDVLMGGASYFNEFISKATAKNIYTFIIDMDNVYSGTLLRALQNDWRTENGEPIPMPTYIVNSGTGLHLYFVLNKPLPCYKSQISNIDQLYRRLAVMETTKRVYLRKSVQWFGQDFRMAGGNGKNGWENTVFKVGDKWDADKLGEAVGLENVHFIHEGEAKPREKKPKEEKKRKSKPRSGYYLNRAVYDTSLERCRSEVHEGNRYTSMCALTVLAWKCKVSQDELETDLLSLLPTYNNNAQKLVKKKEIYSAMRMYNEKAIDTPKVRTQDWLGWEFKGSRRNGRKRDVHLKIARNTRDVLHPDGWQNKDGAPKKADIVQEWRRSHPDGKKAECIRDTGLSKPTVYKWWEPGAVEQKPTPKPEPPLPELKEDEPENGIYYMTAKDGKQYQISEEEHNRIMGELVKEWLKMQEENKENGEKP